MPTLSVYGLSLDVDITYFSVGNADNHANGYSELEWTLLDGKDEIGETILKESLDLISIQFQSDIERAIWAQIGR